MKDTREVRTLEDYFTLTISAGYAASKDPLQKIFYRGLSMACIGDHMLF